MHSSPKFTSCDLCGEAFPQPSTFWFNHLITTSCGTILGPSTLTSAELMAKHTVQLDDGRIYCQFCEQLFPKLPLAWHHEETSEIHRRALLLKEYQATTLAATNTATINTTVDAKVRQDVAFVKHKQSLNDRKTTAIAFLQKQYPLPQNLNDDNPDDDCNDCRDEPQLVRIQKPREGDSEVAPVLSDDAIGGLACFSPLVFLKQNNTQKPYQHDIPVDPFPWYTLGNYFGSPFQMPPRLAESGQRLDWFQSSPIALEEALEKEAKQRELTLRVLKQSRLETPLTINVLWCEVCSKSFSKSDWALHLRDPSHIRAWDSDQWALCPNPAKTIEKAPPPPPRAAVPPPVSVVSSDPKAPVLIPGAKVPLTAPVRISMNKGSDGSSSTTKGAAPPPALVTKQTTPNPSSKGAQSEPLPKPSALRTVPPPQPPAAAAVPTVAPRNPPIQPKQPPPAVPPPTVKSKVSVPTPITTVKRPVQVPAPAGITKIPVSAPPAAAAVISVKCKQCGVHYAASPEGERQHIMSIQHRDAVTKQQETQALLDSGIRPQDLLRPEEESFVRCTNNEFTFVCTLCSVVVSGHELWLKHAGGGRHQQNLESAVQRQVSATTATTPQTNASVYGAPTTTASSQLNSTGITASSSTQPQTSGFYLRPPGAPPQPPLPPPPPTRTVEQEPALFPAPPPAPALLPPPVPPPPPPPPPSREQQNATLLQPLRDDRSFYSASRSDRRDEESHRTPSQHDRYPTKRSREDDDDYADRYRQRREDSRERYHQDTRPRDRSRPRQNIDHYRDTYKDSDRDRGKDSDRSHYSSYRGRESTDDHARYDSSRSRYEPDPRSRRYDDRERYEPDRDRDWRRLDERQREPDRRYSDISGSASSSHRTGNVVVPQSAKPPPPPPAPTSPKKAPVAMPSLSDDEDDREVTGTWTMGSIPGVKGSDANAPQKGVLRKKNGKVIEKITQKFVGTAKNAPQVSGYLKPPGM